MPQRRTIDLVIFDCDGVLVDSEPLSMQVLVETVAELGGRLSMEEGYRLFLGRSEATMRSTLKQQFDIDLDPATVQMMRARLASRFASHLQPISGVGAVLASLDRQRCVASSSTPERIRMSLTRTQLINHFHDNIYSATMVAHGKPAPDLFLHAAREMGMNPANCLVIEDSPAGIEAARRAGMPVFAFTGASHGRIASHVEAVAAASADLIFDDMAALPGLIAAL